MSDITQKSEFYHFGILPGVCIHNPTEDQYFKMYIPREKCDCGCGEWIDGVMEMFVGFPERPVQRCKDCNQVRVADHAGVVDEI